MGKIKQQARCYVTMNEATFEQRISSEIIRCFPFISQNDITHQESFSVKIGHKQYEVAKSRLDVMVKYKGRPIAIWELKAPGIKLSEEDISQCVSYARLTETITPLAIVSNGTETIIIDSYSKKMLDRSRFANIALFEKQINTVSQIASAEVDSAIETLLGIDNDLWNKAVEAINEAAFLKQKGRIYDLEFPISDEFQVERKIVKKLLYKVTTESTLVLTGNPFSGKTNVVYQLCQLAGRNNESIPIYIDLSEPKSIFQHLANKFSSLLSTPISKDNFRHWLINSLCKHAKHRIVFILDNIFSSVENDWKEIYELIEINQSNSFSVILVMNNQIYDDVKRIKGKQALTTIGKSRHYFLSDLSDDEFDKALRMLNQKYKVQIHHGGQFNPEYRWLDMLRLQVSLAYKQNQNPDDTTRLLLPSLTNTSTLISCWNYLNRDIQSGYRSFTKRILKQKIKLTDPVQRFMTYNNGILFISPHDEILEKTFFRDLLASGYFKKKYLNNGMLYLYPVLPYAISVAAAFEIKDAIKSQQCDEEIYRIILDCSQLFPNPDITATLVILLASEDNPYFITRIISKFIDDIPIVGYSEPKRIFLNSCKGIIDLDLSDIEFAEDDKGVMLGNCFPWLVLSNLVSFPFGTRDGDVRLWLEAIIKVGSFSNVLLRVHNKPIEKIKGFHVHSIPDQAEFICGKMGIIEPITLSIQQGFTQLPKEMMKVVQWAITNENVPLKTRLIIALKSLETINDNLIKTYVTEALRLLKTNY